MDITKNPFSDLRLETIEVSVDRLTEDEIKTSMNSDLEKEFTLWHSRNIFLLNFFGDVRISDMLQLRGINRSGGLIDIRVDRVNRNLSNTLSEDVKGILNEYDDFDSLINAYL